MKIGKGLDEARAQRAHDSLQIDSLNLQLAERPARKARKKAVDSNKVFANIETIGVAKEALAASAKAWEARLGPDAAKKASLEAQQLQIDGMSYSYQLGS